MLTKDPNVIYNIGKVVAFVKIYKIWIFRVGRSIAARKLGNDNDVNVNVLTI